MMIAGVLALLLQAGSDAPQASDLPSDMVVRAEWLRRPSGQDMARNYPRGAMQQDLAGETRIQCLVTTEGTLDACQVTEETPPNEGFGQAALTISRIFRMGPTDATGHTTVGRPVRIPIRWVLPTSATAGPIRLQSTAFEGAADVDCRYADGHLDNCLTMRVEPRDVEIWRIVSAYAAKMSLPPKMDGRGRIVLHFEIGRPK